MGAERICDDKGKKNDETRQPSEQHLITYLGVQVARCGLILGTQRVPEPKDTRLLKSLVSAMAAREGRRGWFAKSGRGEKVQLHYPPHIHF